jgi:hypothetical protein
MSEIYELNEEQPGPTGNPNRLYIIIAAILLVIIVVAAVLLITQGLPALIGGQEPTATMAPEPTATWVPTFTPRPTTEPTDTPSPASLTEDELWMSDTDAPIYDVASAGARPGAEWTGFFGQVQDSADTPVGGVQVIIWYRDGQPASPATPTGSDGSYEIWLAEASLAGDWTIQLLNDDGSPASKLFTFQTDENTETGIQQIQVIWKQIP